MECPFLKEARVRYCQVAAYRKMIVDGGAAAPERCSSPDYVGCPAAAARVAGQPLGARCPFLQEARVEYCSAASVTKFIPASDGLLSRCSSESHLYCELYLTRSDPTGERLPHPGEATEIPSVLPAVEGMPVPPNLFYSPNHMWLDIAEDGHCHIGIDSFLAAVLGDVQKVTFSRSVGRPVAVLTTAGADLQMVFPNAVPSATPNSYLRRHPEKIVSDPYGAGWLFEAFEPAPDTARAMSEGLLSGEKAVAWFRDETDRVTTFVHNNVAHTDEDGGRVMADGGRFAGSAPDYLGRDELIHLFNEFFAPHVGWRRTW